MSAFRFFAYTDFEFHLNQSQKYLSLPISLAKPSKHTTDDISHELNIPYTVFEILVAIFAIVGNLMVIVVFQRERKLRRRTNYYIVSLAIADLLVGLLGVPFAIMASIGLPTNLYACLFTVSLLVVLCTISIFCLLAVSVDRYWAILYPMAYSRTVRTRTAIGIISMCWFAGAVVGFLPLFGWHADVGPHQACLFVEVMDYDYLVFLYFATIITPALLMLAFYAHIYRVIVKQVRQIVTMNPLGDCSRRSSTAAIQTNANTDTPSRHIHGGTMLRVLGAARKRDVKATQNLSIIVLFFMFCWFPLYTINCIKAFCPTCDIPLKLTLFCIILSHLNSAVNPVLYAYHLKDFRSALKNLILKVIGVEMEQPLDPMHRFSLASQHRLQTTQASMRAQPKIYIDSPVWLRQQQQKSLTMKNSQFSVKCGVVSPCLSNINQTVTAVASVSTDLQSEVWNIVEKTTVPNEKNTVTFEMDKHLMPVSSAQYFESLDQLTTPEEIDAYNYNNHNYTSSPEDPDFDEVFLPIKSSQLCEKITLERSLREKLSSDRDKSNSTTPSDMEISKLYSTEETRPLQNQLTTSESSSSNTSTLNATIFTVDNSTFPSPLSPGHKPRLKKQRVYLPKAISNPMSRSCSCSSDPPTPSHKSFTNRTKKSINDLFARGKSIDSNGKDSSPSCATHYLTNSLNYYTIPQLSHKQPHISSTGKFSPLKAMSQRLFPPVVKHSSLFHIFQSTSNADSSATTNIHTSTEESNNPFTTDLDQPQKTIGSIKNNMT